MRIEINNKKSIKMQSGMPDFRRFGSTVSLGFETVKDGFKCGMGNFKCGMGNAEWGIFWVGYFRLGNQFVKWLPGTNALGQFSWDNSVPLGQFNSYRLTCYNRTKYECAGRLESAGLFLPTWSKS